MSLPENPLPAAPRLIQLSEILEQPALWRQLVANHRDALAGVPVWDKTLQRVVGVGEGSSFNAFRLAQYQWQLWHPQVAAVCLRPWELQIQLPLGSVERWRHSFWLPITQSAKTASLIAAWRDLRQVIAPLTDHPQGLLLTNTSLADELWHGHTAESQWCSHFWHLRAGPETAIAATKTFTGSLVALWLLGVEQARLSQKWDNPRCQRVLDDLLALSDQVEGWLKQAATNDSLFVMAKALAGIDDYHPAVVLLSAGPLVWSLAEAALKLTETTRQPVLYHHSENFKHGPKAMMSGHPLRHEPPCLLYIVPPTAAEADILYNDVVVHNRSLTDEQVTPKRLWVRFANSPAIPALWRHEPTVTLPPAPNTRAALIWLTLCFQYIGYHISHALDLTSDGLQKAVE